MAMRSHSAFAPYHLLSLPVCPPGGLQQLLQVEQLLLGNDLAMMHKLAADPVGGAAYQQHVADLLLKGAANRDHLAALPHHFMPPSFALLPSVPLKAELSLDTLLDDQRRRPANRKRAKDTRGASDKPLAFTNFGIDDILKPEFGSLTDGRPGSATAAATAGSEKDSLVLDGDAPLPGGDGAWSRGIEQLLQKLTDMNHTEPVSISPSATSKADSTCLSPNMLSRSSQLTADVDQDGVCRSRGASQQLTESNLRLTAPSAASDYGPRRQETPGARSGVEYIPPVWPAWVYCTRYSDRPSSGPRARRARRLCNDDDKRPRTAFTQEQLKRLKCEFDENHYLTEERRQRLAKELYLNECQIKIWFQNRRAKVKKSSGVKSSALALQLMAQGLYNHSTLSPDSLESQASPLPDNAAQGDCAASPMDTLPAAHSPHPN